MKKIIALVLVLTFVLALASCGVSIPAVKECKNDVDVEEFYDELRKELELNDEDIFDESLEAVSQSVSNSVSKIEIKDGKTFEGKENATSTSGLKYDKKGGITHITANNNASESAHNGSSSEESKRDYIHYQDGKDVQSFDNQTMTYTEDKDDENGVFEAVDSSVRSDIKIIFSGIISYELLSSNVANNIAGLISGLAGADIDDMMGFDKDVDVEYYIDDNVYTVVYVKETDNDDDADAEYDMTSTTEITVQIVFADADNTTIVRQEKTTTVREYKKYTETLTEEKASSFTIKLADVKLAEPDTKKFVKLS